jgi:hypothetical protein
MYQSRGAHAKVLCQGLLWLPSKPGASGHDSTGKSTMLALPAFGQQHLSAELGITLARST